MRKEPQASHEQKETEAFEIIYPDHPPRKESPEYIKTHKYLVHEKKLPCFVNFECVDGPLETHHFEVEYAAMDAVDWVKFGQIAKNLTNPQTGITYSDKYDWKEVAKNPTLFVDSVDNMIVLCSKHHRDKTYGIHHVPYPIWKLQLAPKDGFEFLEAMTNSDHEKLHQ